MKRFIVRVFVFFAVVAMIDVAFGYGMDYLFPKAKGGEIKETNDVCLNNYYDIVVMGSSRAHHHYVPEIFNDSMELSCFNIGKNGNGIVLMYGFYKMIIDRYKPSLIVYDVSRFDIYEMAEDQGNTRYISMLKPYSNKVGVDEIFKSLSWQEWAKNYSSLYRYNSVSFETFRQYFWPTSFCKDGYLKMEGSMEGDPQDPGTQYGEKDALKLQLFNEFVASTKENEIPLVCVLSPSYNAISSDAYDTIKRVCELNNIPFLDFYASASLSRNKEYFDDRTHMNDRGARAFTNEIVKALDSIMTK